MRRTAGRQATTIDLPQSYFRLLKSGLVPIEKRLAKNPNHDLASIEAALPDRHFPGSILAASVLFDREHPHNPCFGDRTYLSLAVKIGDLLARENQKGTFTKRLDHHRDTYMWLESYRLLQKELKPDRSARWEKEIKKNVKGLAADVLERVDYPRYQAPFIRTSPNHYSLWASTVYLAGRVFDSKEWRDLGAHVLHRFATREQTQDGYWGEHSDSGPTTGYDFLTFTALALYYEHSGDTMALQALRRGTDFHKFFTYPDGTPVETINDRNRHWAIDDWGHFGFTHFPDGRRYAEFLTTFLSRGKIGCETMGRLAQNALYFHEGPIACIPQDLQSYSHRMSVPAGIRKSGHWVFLHVWTDQSAGRYESVLSGSSRECERVP